MCGRWQQQLTMSTQLGYSEMGGCQNYGPFLGTLNIRCRTIIGTQKGTIILTTTQMNLKGDKEGERQGLKQAVQCMDGMGIEAPGFPNIPCLP